MYDSLCDNDLQQKFSALTEAVGLDLDEAEQFSFLRHIVKRRILAECKATGKPGPCAKNKPKIAGMRKSSSGMGLKHAYPDQATKTKAKPTAKKAPAAKKPAAKKATAPKKTSAGSPDMAKREATAVKDLKQLKKNPGIHKNPADGVKVALKGLPLASVKGVAGQMGIKVNSKTTKKSIIDQLAKQVEAQR